MRKKKEPLYTLSLHCT